MRFGTVFPQIEFPADPALVRDYAQTVEGAGLSYVDAYDHVLGANPNRPGGWTGPYTFESSFLEPFVLYSYMAAVTKQLEVATNIIILPQRQTALVAKQAATLDVSVVVACDWAWGSDGTRSSTSPSTRTSIIAVAGSKSKSRCYGPCGRNRW